MPTETGAFTTGAVLVTGGSGFVGRAVLRELQARDYTNVAGHRRLVPRSP